MINLMIHGHTGKLGKKIINNLEKNLNINYFGFINTRDENFDYSILKNKQNLVIVDVTIDVACQKLLTILISKDIYVPLIIGTTGDLPVDLIN